MTLDGRRLLEHFSSGKCEQRGGFYRAEYELGISDHPGHDLRADPAAPAA
jgi:hypothetical protein